MSTVQVIKYVKGSYQTNIYLVYDPDTKDSFIVDPGYPFIEIINDAHKLGLEPEYIILTHGHGDHTGGIDLIKENFPDIEIVACKKESKLLYNRDFSMGKGGIVADINVQNGDKLRVGSLELEFIETPGHTAGSMCIKMNNILFSGDTLFRGSVGRTDFPTGNEEAILNSLRDVLMKLPDETRVLPGHMAETSIGIERRYNPFV